MITYLLVLLLCVEAASSYSHSSLESSPSFILPSRFLGRWMGRPSFSVVGPWSRSYTFDIAQAANGDYLMENNIKFEIGQEEEKEKKEELLDENDDIMGWQRFYIEGSGDSAGTLWYCGALLHFFDSPALAGGTYNIAFSSTTASPAPTEKSLTFCLDLNVSGTYGGTDVAPWPTSSCTGCSCAQWTLELTDHVTRNEDDDKDNVTTTTLTSTVTMGGASTHLSVTMVRVGDAPPVTMTMPGHGADFKCNFTEGGRDSVRVPNVDSNNQEKDTHDDDDDDDEEKNNVIDLKSTAGSLGSCMFARSNRKSPHPHHQKLSSSSSSLSSSSSSSSSLSASSSSYDHCYYLNRHLNYTLEWSLSPSSATIDVRISASTPPPSSSSSSASSSSYFVALGFRPLSNAPVGNGQGEIPALFGTGRQSEFGMMGADIVAGFASSSISSSSSSNGTVSTYYASEYVGAPISVDPSSLSLSDTSAVFDSLHNMTRVSFKRALVGGYLLSKFGVQASILSGAGDVLWAVGEGGGDTNQLTYHGPNRGVRFVNWEEPELAMDPYFKC